MAAEAPPGPVARLVQLLGMLATVGFIALLVYGVLAQAPETTIDDALATRRPVAAPGFKARRAR